ncbi:MAG: hypothetical protein IT355_02660 [Gemmatimonadaceae bacterium]|nr:hypothetical protein [Gemmatimonadaceae bacterium]
MSQTLTATCPACKAQISEDDLTCAHCGAGVNEAWPESTGRAPLILPGNTGLSADLFQGKVSPVRVIAGVAVGVAVLAGGLLLSSSLGDKEDDGEPAAVAVSAGSAFADSLPPDTATSPYARGAEPAVTVPAAAPAPRDSVVAAATVVPEPAPAPPAVAQPSTPLASDAPATPTPDEPTAANAVLRLQPLVSDTLRPGELLQLRWAVRDRESGRTVRAPVEFTSTNADVLFVDRRTGAITAVNPGRARIIADAGRLGQRSVTLTVFAPPQPVVVAPRVAPTRTATVAEPPPSVAAAPVAIPTPPPAAREPARPELPGSDDIRSVVDRFVASVRARNVRNFELMQFLADGADHRVTLASGPSTISSTAYAVRVTFEIRLSKYDAAGRPVSRVASVSMDVEKRESGVSSSALAIGALRRP